MHNLFCASCKVYLGIVPLAKTEINNQSVTEKKSENIAETNSVHKDHITTTNSNISITNSDANNTNENNTLNNNYTNNNNNANEYSYSTTENNNSKNVYITDINKEDLNCAQTVVYITRVYTRLYPIFVHLVFFLFSPFLLSSFFPFHYVKLRHKEYREHKK
jgi:hypothetical protein